MTTTSTHVTNPFYANHRERSAPRTAEPTRHQYARLPVAPRNASPVPHLTSLYHFHRAGEYGDRKWPGNCGGNLIKDLLLYFQPGLVLDPMRGSGTCQDVCEELRIPCIAWDIHDGIDACDPQGFGDQASFDFIWAHPPYFRQKLSSTDPRDLSRAPTLDVFLRRYGQFIRNCARALKPTGKLVILMGDYSDRQYGFIPLTFHTKRFAFARGLVQHGTDIIRFSHGASSGKKVYKTAFIPGLHDVCMIFKKGSSFFTTERARHMTDDSVPDELFPACAPVAFVRQAWVQRSRPDSRATQRLANQLYEDALAAKNGRVESGGVTALLRRPHRARPLQQPIPQRCLVVRRQRFADVAAVALDDAAAQVVQHFFAHFGLLVERHDRRKGVRGLGQQPVDQVALDVVRVGEFA